MRLRSAQVRLFRSIVDSTEVEIDPTVTCLVGMNEAGKTSFLQALWYLNPSPKFTVSVTRDYPRWRKVRDGTESELEQIDFVTARFDLSPEDLALGVDGDHPQLPPGTQLVTSKNYAGDLSHQLELPDQKPWVDSLVDDAHLESEADDRARKQATLDELLQWANETLKGMDKRKRDAAKVKQLAAATKTARRTLLDSDDRATLCGQLWERSPKFFYFSEYGTLPNRIDIGEIFSEQEEDQSEAKRTARALLHMARITRDDISNDDFEQRIAELEAASNEISRQVFEFWSQNKDLQVQLHADSKIRTRADGQPIHHRILDLRLNDTRHQVSTNFSTRSTGFQWFFSFLAAFSGRPTSHETVVLLDEPGLGLHAKAQNDLLRYIDERLGATSQVLYSAHSPFMVNPRELKRVRLVEDLTSREYPDVGARVSSTGVKVRKDTIFPLQAALGYELTQSLFVGGLNLVVEGPSDYLYLNTLSEHLKELSMEHLDERVVIVPVGGLDKIPTFVALLGAHVDVTVLIDSSTAPNQKLHDLLAKGILEDKRLVPVGRAADCEDADIEDLFEPEEYLQLFNKSCNATIEHEELHGSPRIVKRVEQALKSDFDHLKPARQLVEDGPEELGEATLARFEKLFQLLNSSFA